MLRRPRFSCIVAAAAVTAVGCRYSSSSSAASQQQQKPLTFLRGPSQAQRQRTPENAEETSRNIRLRIRDVLTAHQPNSGETSDANNCTTTTTAVVCRLSASDNFTPPPAPELTRQQLSAMRDATEQVANCVSIRGVVLTDDVLFGAIHANIACGMHASAVRLLSGGSGSTTTTPATSSATTAASQQQQALETNKDSSRRRRKFSSSMPLSCRVPLPLQFVNDVGVVFATLVHDSLPSTCFDPLATTTTTANTSSVAANRGSSKASSATAGRFAVPLGSGVASVVEDVYLPLVAALLDCGVLVRPSSTAKDSDVGSSAAAATQQDRGRYFSQLFSINDTSNNGDEATQQQKQTKSELEEALGSMLVSLARAASVLGDSEGMAVALQTTLLLFDPSTSSSSSDGVHDRHLVIQEVLSAVGFGVLLTRLLQQHLPAGGSTAAGGSPLLGDLKESFVSLLQHGESAAGENGASSSSSSRSLIQLANDILLQQRRGVGGAPADAADDEYSVLRRALFYTTNNEIGGGEGAADEIIASFVQSVKEANADEALIAHCVFAAALVLIAQPQIGHQQRVHSKLLLEQLHDAVSKIVRAAPAEVVVVGYPTLGYLCVGIARCSGFYSHHNTSALGEASMEGNNENNQKKKKLSEFIQLLLPQEAEGTRSSSNAAAILRFCLDCLQEAGPSSDLLSVILRAAVATGDLPLIRGILEELLHQQSFVEQQGEGGANSKTILFNGVTVAPSALAAVHTTARDAGDVEIAMLVRDARTKLFVV